MNTHCRHGHKYPSDLKLDSNGHRRCPTCKDIGRAKNAEPNRRIRREFSGSNKVRAIGDDREARMRAAAADWAYGDRSELRYG